MRVIFMPCHMALNWALLCREYNRPIPTPGERE
uniref:Uncharacterized protein n=1 Tax=Myoviridae sp. ctMvU7 TaxID=2826642 RepID=A0A8S5M8F1_9CAUD|nr:MAG TPA: hypothetical protein [Myoviridae sp. ctMvU7]